jgi:cholecystokinin A receptor
MNWSSTEATVSWPPFMEPLNDTLEGNLSVTRSVLPTRGPAAWWDAGRVQIPLYSLIFLLAVVGNALVILTLVQNQRMRTITNVFLLNLAVSDLLLGVFCMPFTLIGALLRDFVFGELMCKLIPYSQGKQTVRGSRNIPFC